MSTNTLFLYDIDIHRMPVTNRIQSVLHFPQNHTYSAGNRNVFGSSVEAAVRRRGTLLPSADKFNAGVPPFRGGRPNINQKARCMIAQADWRNAHDLMQHFVWEPKLIKIRIRFFFFLLLSWMSVSIHECECECECSAQTKNNMVCRNANSIQCVSRCTSMQCHAYLSISISQIRESQFLTPSVMCDKADPSSTGYSHINT